ncbi:ABC transporter substrate-binding protein [Anaerosacchariphilus polymeriproducens]|uniref:Extracellular solute-binding protein n=1 Tax=Anaerosacchariphilus polymeriproducens TaxID=1812858 RepID=A0A371AX62_9FIRM|nr:extracellular solute-binding protein [Anaerosacchariphilus polymeriproducens]RDU24070.1 extracellular solute-binding protein [Anaerosacchariphilus polymeriproducens]
MKKKNLAVLMCTVIVATSLIGCKGAKRTTNQSPDEIGGEITVITHRTDIIDTKMADYKKAFEKKYPGTTVKFEAVTDYETDIAIRLQTEEYGDVLMLPSSIKNTDFPNYFESLGTVDELKKKYDERFLYSKFYDGKVYGLASNCNVQGMVYNKKVFKEAGITKMPTTPEEFLNCLKQVKQKTKAIPYYTNFAAGWPLVQWQDQCWGSVSGDKDYHNNTIVHEKDPFSEGKPNYVVHKLLYDIVKQGLCENDPVTSDWEQSKVMLNNGEIAVMDLGSWAISQIKAAGSHPDDVGYMPFPWNINGKQYATAGADYCYAINTHSENKATARAWIDYMIDETGFALSEGSISILKSDPLPDTLKDFTKAELVVDAPATTENDGLFDVLNNESEIALTSDIEKKRIVEAALGSSGESFDNIMKDWNARWAQAQKDNDVEVK